MRYFRAYIERWFYDSPRNGWCEEGWVPFVCGDGGFKSPSEWFNSYKEDPKGKVVRRMKILHEISEEDYHTSNSIYTIPIQQVIYH